MKSYKQLIKQAGIYEDVYGAAANPLNVVANPIAMISGLASNPDKVDDDTGLGSVFLPGAGLHRAIRKSKRAEKDYAGKKQVSKTVSHILGPATASIISVLGGGLAGAGIGAGIGALAGKTGKGALIGAGIGQMAGAATTAVAQLIAQLRAAHKSTWTKDEMSEYINEGSAAANYFVPGLASYRNYKTIGRINRDEHNRLQAGEGYESGRTEKRKAKKAQKQARKAERKGKDMEKEASLKKVASLVCSVNKKASGALDSKALIKKIAEAKTPTAKAEVKQVGQADKTEVKPVKPNNQKIKDFYAKFVASKGANKPA